MIEEWATATAIVCATTAALFLVARLIGRG